MPGKYGGGCHRRGGRRRYGGHRRYGRRRRYGGHHGRGRVILPMNDSNT